MRDVHAEGSDGGWSQATVRVAQAQTAITTAPPTRHARVEKDCARVSICRTAPSAAPAHVRRAQAIQVRVQLRELTSKTYDGYV